MRRRERRPIDRPARWKVLLRRQRRMVRPVLAVTALCVAALGFVAGVQALGSGASFSERFGEVTARLGLNVRHVLVEGRQKTPESLLREAIGVAPGDPLLTWSADAARTRVEAIKWVRGAVVRRVLPDTITVQLTERRPFAVWQHDGKFVLVDRDGNTVTDSDVALFASQLPLVVGSGAPLAAGPLIDTVTTLPAIQSHLQAAVRVGGRRWNLRMSNGADVLLPEGEPAQAQALATLARLEAAHKLLDRPLQAIDLRLADRLVIRPVADSHPAEELPTTDAARPAEQRGPT